MWASDWAFLLELPLLMVPQIARCYLDGVSWGSRHRGNLADMPDPPAHWTCPPPAGAQVPRSAWHYTFAPAYVAPPAEAVPDSRAASGTTQSDFFSIDAGQESFFHSPYIPHMAMAMARSQPQAASSQPQAASSRQNLAVGAPPYLTMGTLLSRAMSWI